ncbi:MAG: thermonuclease family protein [Pseudomonadota bacterium]
MEPGRWVLIVLTFAIAGLVAAAASAQTVEGRARVIDGDTLEVAGERIRIEGLHAPELTEPAGEVARAFVEQLVRDETVRCVSDGQRSYRRLVARCFVHGSEDVAAALVSAGLGRDCTRYSGGRYAGLETSAGRALPLPSYCRR